MFIYTCHFFLRICMRAFYEMFMAVRFPARLPDFKCARRVMQSDCLLRPIFMSVLPHGTTQLPIDGL